MSENTYRVRIWHSYHDEYPDTPDETVEVKAETPHLWKDDPRFNSGPCAFDLHPDDTPATLEIYTSESVRSPPGYENHVETAYWDGPVERGLLFDSEQYDDRPPFGCEIWGRVLFYVSDD